MTAESIIIKAIYILMESNIFENTLIMIFIVFKHSKLRAKGMYNTLSIKREAAKGVIDEGCSTIYTPLNILRI
jgi:hypothetical protein